MADIPCCNPCVACEPSVAVGAFGLNPLTSDPNNPFLNLSSAAPDESLFISVHYVPPGVPPIGSIWTAPSCTSFCFSTESQAAADQCAAIKNAQCISNNWPVTLPNPNVGDPVPPGFPNPPSTIQVPRELFASAPQSCDSQCTEGGDFTYTIPAGAVQDLSQAAADARARIIACQRAILLRICIGELADTVVCLGGSYDSSVAVDIAFGQPFTASISDGALPPGISLSQEDSSVTFSGTPSSAGVYPFTLHITDGNGIQQSRSFVISVISITSDSPLSSGRIGNIYSYQFVAQGLSGIEEWSVASGSIPPGLSLSSAGLLSGVPTGSAASHNFTVQVGEPGGVQCSKGFTITINSGVSWGELIWTVPVDLSAPGQLASFFPNLGGVQGTSFNASATAQYQLVPSTGRMTCSCYIDYNGPAVNAAIQANVLFNQINVGLGGSTFFQMVFFRGPFGVGGGSIIAQVGGSLTPGATGPMTLPIVSGAGAFRFTFTFDIRASNGGLAQVNPVFVSTAGTFVNL